MSRKKSGKLEAASPEKLRQRGIELSESGLVEQAEAVFRAALKQKPDYAEAWDSLGYLLWHSDRFDEAEEAYRTAIQCKSEYAEAWYHLGNLLDKMNRTHEAEDALRCAISHNHELGKAWNNLGLLLFRSGRVEEGLDALRQVTRADAFAAIARHNLGDLLQELKRYKEAEEAYRTALELDPKQARTWYGLGSLLRELKRYDEAEEAYRKAREFDRDTIALKGAVKEAMTGSRRQERIAVLERALILGEIGEMQRLMTVLVRRKGWKQALSEVLAVLERVHGGAWFARNRALLSLMNCEELLGFDGDVEKVLSRLPDSHDFKSVQTEAQDLLIEEVHRQVGSGGSTLFFNLEAMQTKRTAVLIGDLSSARKREFTDHGKPFLDRLQGARDYGSEWLEWDDPLRYTHYGFNLLWSLCHQDENSYLGHHHNWEARELLSKAFVQLADPANPVPEVKSGIPSPASARLLQLVDAAFRCIEWLGPSEDELSNLDMLSSKRGPSLGILFESGYLDAFVFASYIVSGREWSLRNAESLESLDVPLALKTVGIKEFALWEFTAMSEIDHLLCWAVKALAGRKHPRSSTLLKDVAPLIYSFESGAFAELLDGARPEGYVDALVVLGKKLYENYESDDYSYLDAMDRVISVLVKNADYINDADRSDIIHRIQSREDISEPSGQSHGAELASSFVDKITKQNDIVLHLLPRKNAVDRAKSMLVGEHFIGHHHYSLDTWVKVCYLDINIEGFLMKNQVDVVEILTKFAMPDYRNERYWIRLAVVRHIIDSHKESLDRLRSALLNAETQAWVPEVGARREPVWREDNYYFSIGARCENEADHNYEDELMAILGDIGPFAVMGEVLLSYIAWDEESARHPVHGESQADTWKEEARDNRRSVTSLAEGALKDPGPAKALEVLSRLSVAERKAAVLCALKHTHPKPRAGACWYIWLTGTKSPAILQELNKILKASPNDEIVLTALDKLGQ